ncbi:arginine decarboxylase [Lewinella sp. 4G2]|uniref:arginine decarboxylase n=1 Tax=Lewinella sp. 4G2 TaxID=1803372 RepID=UPI0007B4C51D|nr:arginine decarboxylase [Lewinella sp. 4G2]OAV45318.1 arginine decarboxylase [Lewinella sp. 4G2]
MANKYFDLIDQTFYFPQEGFDLDKGYLTFNNIPLIHLINKYGTPLKLTYLPSIGRKIKQARNLFRRAMRSQGYTGNYHYCYCTKSSHFAHVVEEALKFGAQLELSSAYDVELVRKLYENGKIDKTLKIVCNGFKPVNYLSAIVGLMNDGFSNVIAVVDNAHELDYYEQHVQGVAKIGIRVATEEEPNFEFYTSRLGLRGADVIPLFENRIKGNPKLELTMLHFFVDTGIKDSLYYWGELKKAVRLYGELKQHSPSLTGLNIGGGMPIRNSLGFEFDYKYMVREIVANILEACEEMDVTEPDIYTEFGKYTVGESGATIFSVLEQKQQNDSEMWYMIDNSLMTTLPDAWGINERFILLPVNKWDHDYRRVNIGGLSCDNSDYYNSEIHESQVYLPVNKADDVEPLYLGFFHTGAYQDSISGYGGIKHCMIPSPQHILIDLDEQGNLTDRLLYPTQTAESMLAILGYQ